MSAKRIGAAAVVAVLALAAAGVVWWRVDLRWRPHSLTRDPAQIAEMLNQSGWVSPGLSKTRVLWMISYRSCPDCIRFEDEEFPRLQAAGVDTRVIMTPRPHGATPQERASVAALWSGRSWALYRQWTKTPPAAWTAPGLRPVDDDPAGAAELRRAAAFISGMTPLLRANGVQLHYPTLIWRDLDGRWRGCACEKRRSYAYVRRELGVS